MFYEMSRIFVVEPCEKIAGMLCAFQDFAVRLGGKKTGRAWNIFAW